MQTNPPVSVVVCTFNRAHYIRASIASILDNNYPDFEVLVVDQSINTDTRDALADLMPDSRLRYLPTSSRGKGVALNIGLNAARSNVVLFTDDDCVAAENWIAGMVYPFQEIPTVALVFCNVDQAPHDDSQGFIPHFHRDENRLKCSFLDFFDFHQGVGLGAGMGVRRDVIFSLGGFDPAMGPGGIFPSSDDMDAAYRVILHGWGVYENADVSVVHHGFRSWYEGKALTRRDWEANGAVFGKMLQCGYWKMACLAGYIALHGSLFKPLSEALRGKRPRGFKRVLYMWSGIRKGYKTPVNKRTIVFLPPYDADA